MTSVKVSFKKLILLKVSFQFNTSFEFTLLFVITIIIGKWILVIK